MRSTPLLRPAPLFGIDQTPLFLPDIGTYFNQDMALAHSLVTKLAQSGCKVIKGEILHDADICLPRAGKERYWSPHRNRFVEEDYRTLIERKVVSLDAYAELFQYCQRCGLHLVLSVYDFEGADFAREMGAVALKIASSNVTHQPLIEHVASLGLPVLLDTGHATLEEIARAVNWLHDAGCTEMILQHSPPGPPHPPEQHNLRFMTTLADAFSCLAGLSDHFAGAEMLYAATVMGAAVLEKGVCPDDMGDEQDGAHALPVSHIAEVLSRIEMFHRALGDGQRKLSRNRKKYHSRMGLVSGRPLEPGDKISLDTVRFAFPAKGIGTEHWGEVRNWRIRKVLPAGQPIDWCDVEPVAT